MLPLLRLMIAMSYRFSIPYGKDFSKRYGLNAYYSGKHWTVRKNDADYWHCLVISELRKQGIPKQLIQNPVKITFSFNSRMDIDNHAVMEKYIVDSLKGYLLQDDTRKFYIEKTTKFSDKNYIEVEVQEVEHKESTDGYSQLY